MVERRLERATERPDDPASLESHHMHQQLFIAYLSTQAAWDYSVAVVLPDRLFEFFSQFFSGNKAHVWRGLERELSLGGLENCKGLLMRPTMDPEWDWRYVGGPPLSAV